MTADQKLTGQEVAEHLRRAIRGEIPIRLQDPKYTWSETFAGDVTFVIGDWRVIFFNDCDELDYCDSAETPDGRTGDFDAWWDAKAEPTNLLTLEENADLERLLEQAT